MIICLSPGICIKLIGSLNCGHSHCRLLMVFHVDHIVFRERWFWFFPNLQAFLVMLAQCPLFGEYEPFYDGPSVHLTQLRLGPPIPCGTTCSNLILYIPCPNSIHQHFSRNYWFYVEGGNWGNHSLRMKNRVWPSSLVSHRTMTIAKPPWYSLMYQYIPQ